MSETKVPRLGFHLDHEHYKQPGLIELKSGRLSAVVNPLGAYLEKLSLDDGNYGTSNLLLPKQEIETPKGLRVRGGSHICLPTFGPREGLDQHGFGRNLPWEVLSQSDQHVSLTLTIEGDESVKGANLYAGLFAQLEYRIDDTPEGQPSLGMDLIVDNYGSDPMLLAPGFHPYLMLPRGISADKVTISNIREPGRSFGFRTFDKAELEKTRFVNTKDATLEIIMGQHLQVDIAHQNLPVNAVWSDNPKTFICVEPTASGVQVDSTSESDMLLPGQMKEYATQMRWVSFGQEKQAA